MKELAGKKGKCSVCWQGITLKDDVIRTEEEEVVVIGEKLGVAKKLWVIQETPAMKIED